MSGNKKHWTKLNTEEIFKTSFFRFRKDEARLPNGKICPRYYVMDFPDWVNVVPVTSDGRLILIKQYRHAVEQVCLEIPGGSLDPRANETPEKAGLRELVEETGYVPAEMVLLGSHLPNPALQSNKLWTYLALGCEKKHEQKLDEYEDIEVLTASIEEAFGLVRDGSINHSLMIASLHLAQFHLFKGR
jgi:ADP-ribose pyrophosphatase